MAHIIPADVIIPGNVTSEVLAAEEPLSFWGGYSHKTGEIIDRRHPLSGQNAAGRILAIPFTRGSSTTTAVLLEAVRAKTAPAAIITSTPDSFLALASIVADELYQSPIPLLVISQADLFSLHTGDRLRIASDGFIYRQK
jgi:predicted aconitase with swiveling domain